VTYAVLASVILITAALVIRRSLRMVPTGIQNFIEVVVETFLKLTEENVGHHWGKTFFPLIGTLFMFIAKQVRFSMNKPVNTGIRTVFFEKQMVLAIYCK
ncbi:MAG: F0F1 ATP synthase subunit A, partial [Planctomycetes bacterium]|nr:F0F1 ATP synthase subunit A [Planctomycetota bacterium]